MNVASILRGLHRHDPRALARAITMVEEQLEGCGELLDNLDRDRIEQSLVLGLTGPPGAGKSTLTGRLVQVLRGQGCRVGVLAIDPSSPISGGALLGDRIRMMDHAVDPGVMVRSMASRGRLGGVCASAGAAARIMAAAGCRVVLLETVGIGQSEMDIVRLADITVLVVSPGFGDDIQAMKAGILEVADLFVVNKADLPGSSRLEMELRGCFDDPREGEKRIVKTVAMDGEGVDALVRRITDLEKRWRETGRFARRRRRAHAAETLEWAVDMVRARLAKGVDEQGENGPDPRVAAENLVRRLLPSLNP